MKFVHVFYACSPLHVNLNSPPSGIFSHFVYFSFLALFLFGLVLSALHLKTLIGTRGTCFCCTLPSPFFSLITLLPLLSFLTLPILDFSTPFLLSLMFFLVLSPHPSRQADWGAPLGRCWQTAAGLFGGLYQVARDTYKGILHLSCYIVSWSDSYSTFRVVYTVPLSKLWKIEVQHNVGSICQYLMSYICFLVLGDCAEIRSHNINSNTGRMSSAALARDLGLPVFLSLRRRTFKNDTFLLCSSTAWRVKSTPLWNAETGSFQCYLFP